MPAIIRGVARLSALTLVPAAITLGPVVRTDAADEATAATPAQTSSAGPASADRAGDAAGPKKNAKGSKRSEQRKRERKARKRVASKVQEAATIALRQRGDSYGYGASGPSAFDCSGLVMYAFHRAGLGGVPRTSDAQAGHTRRIAKGDLRRGDLMFFTGSGGVYHAAIFVKWAGKRPIMVHAPGSGQQVRLASPWTSSWFAGTLRRA